ncbi:hypothetical protein [Profundibacterium mesophilum]|uniref:Uncharacterized protein n=1 Tax=Profundibacterium mesophilum KAUST100406-0324 TaxID=1037889 RepID=A0A921NUB7_9RHOB|nr:hypothetical protein [Profundibacterium mesophilum]KAF0676789.1 hypothetical protein PMES_00876 [Profundibacterium mesophilum KAUST100406-0324]
MALAGHALMGMAANVVRGTAVPAVPACIGGYTARTIAAFAMIV